jgi:hypothetical protein
MLDFRPWELNLIFEMMDKYEASIVNCKKATNIWGNTSTSRSRIFWWIHPQRDAISVLWFLGIVGESISGARERANFLGCPNYFVPCRVTTLLTFLLGTQHVLAEILEGLPLPTWCTTPSSRLSNTIDTPTTICFCNPPPPCHLAHRLS